MAANMIGAPQQEMMGAGGDLFNGAKKLFIKQEMAVIELCGIEAKQRYRVSEATAENTEGQVFLYVTEESQCMERICCSKNRSLKLLVHSGQTKDGPIVQTMEKPFSCSGPWPCCRPSFAVYAGAAGSNMVGRVEDPCHICTMDQKVFDASGSQIFSVDGSICQGGMCCPCCCGVFFKAKKGDSEVAAIEKLPLDCGDICLKTNRFTLDFDKITDPAERRMMFASAMLLDLEYFEEDK